MLVRRAPQGFFTPGNIASLANIKHKGAAWLHETSQNRLVKLISKLKLDYYYDDGLPLYYTEQGRAGAQFKAKKVADEAADHMEWWYETHPDAPDQTVSDFVNGFVAKHELITEDERLWAPQAFKEVELWIGTNVETASAKNLSYFVTERKSVLFYRVSFANDCRQLVYERWL